MNITAIHERTLPLASSMRNAVIDFSTMTVSVVAVVTDVIRDGRPVTGYGFNSNGRYAQGGIIRERFAPRLLGAAPGALADADGANLDPFKCLAMMMTNEKPGGHGERSVAAGTLDMAFWDIVAKIEDKPLWRLLADRYNGGAADPRVNTYAAGGYYHPGKGLEALQDELRGYLDLGFTSCKIKVGGAPTDGDLRRIEAAIDVLGDGSRLAVDANGGFDLATAIKFQQAIQPYGLKWYEEPVEPLDFEAHAELAASAVTPLATGENLFSCVDTRNFARHAGFDPHRDFLQVDPVLSYGLAEYLGIIEMLRGYGWSTRRLIPHGGHLFGMHIAAGLQLYGMESYPHVFDPYGKYARGMTLEDGKVDLLSLPGIGYEDVPGVDKLMRALAG
jgi:L-alanine-DL-glutamate epimerase-like enolase superfamily enzyme